MPTKDYIPGTDAELIPWLTNFKAKIANVTSTLKLPKDGNGDLPSEIDDYIQSIHKANTKKEEWSSAVAEKNDKGTDVLGKVRAMANLIKASSGYTEGIGQELGIIGGAKVINKDTYKPELKAVVIGGLVRISFKKRGTDGVNIYRRRKGEMTWQFLARDTASPYEDRIKLAVDGQPEHWEYRAYAVIKDDEIGQPSDVVEVVFGG